MKNSGKTCCRCGIRKSLPCFGAERGACIRCQRRDENVRQWRKQQRHKAGVWAAANRDKITANWRHFTDQSRLDLGINEFLTARGNMASEMGIPRSQLSEELVMAKAMLTSVRNEIARQDGALKVGRPSFSPTDTQRKFAMLSIAAGRTQNSVASALGIHVDTLRKHFRAEIDEVFHTLHSESSVPHLETEYEANVYKR